MAPHNTQRNKSRTAARRGNAPSESFLHRILRSYLLTLALGAGLILIASLAVSFHPDPDSLIRPLAYLSLALTTLMGGYLSGRIHGKAPLTAGGVNGLLLLLLMLPVSFGFRSMSAGYSPLLSLALHGAVLPLSALGAIAGCRKRQRR